MGTLAEIQLGLTILGDVRTALPIVAQAIVDLKQAFADKADPSKAAEDLANAIGTLEPLVNQVLQLIPAAQPLGAPGTPTTPNPEVK